MDRISYDELKRIANFNKHGYDFADLDVGFFEEAAVLPARSGRWKAIGWFQGATIAVIFQPLGREAVSVISMRRARRNERQAI